VKTLSIPSESEFLRLCSACNYGIKYTWELIGKLGSQPVIIAIDKSDPEFPKRAGAWCHSMNKGLLKVFDSVS
jgi:hypothetical protein